MALAILAGLAIPIVGSAASYELTILNPKADFQQINNAPLADRQPLLDKLENKEPLKLLVLYYGKFSNANETWAMAIAMKDYWVTKYGYANAADISLTPVWNNVIATVNGVTGNTSSMWKALGIPPPLGTPWGTKSGKNYIDGMPLKEEPFERYRVWSGYDAVVFGVMD